ncbi:GntR family transcriptional regulator [Sciscionella marina]|uniref:GntR family transcriptional regulator n=1 Tax=Sciscionella marina TaxID=508770 RepID=UPI000380F706|nr:GntR family transcriptional regulator [Sciscionella marina]
MTSHLAAHPYQVVAGRIIEKIQAGDLKPGEKLPSVRGLARDADVSTVTAQKVLTYLAELGHAEVVSGLGYFVTEQQPGNSGVSLETVTDQLDQLQRTVADLASRVERLENPPESER